VDLRGLAAICAEIRERTAGPDPDDDPRLDRSVSVDTTMDGVGVMRADLTAECAAMVTSVLDALSAPTGGGDLRTQPQRYPRCAGGGDASAVFLRHAGRRDDIQADGAEAQLGAGV
jgi:hypothetical protein